MVAFALSGLTTIPDGIRRAAAVSWTDGELDGDPELVSEALRRVAAGTTVSATPTGPDATAATSPLAAAAILLASLFQAFDASGDFPDGLLDVDDGAIP